MLKLYFSPFTSSLATHIALLEAGAEHELIPRLLSKQATRTPEYLAINPDGKVPVLVTESGGVLTEVAATLYYIARKYPAAQMWPEGDLEAESQVISWMSFAASRFHASRALGPQALAATTAVANAKLGDRQWAIGRFTVADIHLFRVFWRFRAGIDAPPRHLRGTRVASRPDARTAERAEGAGDRKDPRVSRQSMHGAGLPPRRGNPVRSTQSNRPNTLGSHSTMPGNTMHKMSPTTCRMTNGVIAR